METRVERERHNFWWANKMGVCQFLIQVSIQFPPPSLWCGHLRRFTHRRPLTPPKEMVPQQTSTICRLFETEKLQRNCFFVKVYSRVSK